MDIETRLQELREKSRQYAKDYATVGYLEEFKKSKLAILMKQAETKGFTTAAAQEREARANPEYITLLEGLQEATERAESLRWELRIAEMGAEIWRTQQATKRAEMNLR
jgi:hypothetical protein